MGLRKPHNVQALEVAATYIGTIVGAGFASGQEILCFFTIYGYQGVIGVVFSTILFGIFGVMILELGRKLRAESYQEIFNYACGDKIGKVLDILVTVILLGKFGVMLAGAGAVCVEHFGLPYNFGVLLTTAIVVYTVFYGMRGIVTANNVVVPLLLLCAMGVSLHSLGYHGFNLTMSELNQFRITDSSNWLLSAVLYVSFNLTFSVAVLGPLGKEINDRRTLLKGGLIGALGLGILVTAINLVMLVHWPQISDYEVPMLYIVGPYWLFTRLAYTVVLWAEIYTTAIGNIFGFAMRITAGIRLNYKKVVLISTLFAIILSQIGFSRLVNVLYPFSGYLGLIFLAGLMTRVVCVKSSG